MIAVIVAAFTLLAVVIAQAWAWGDLWGGTVMSPISVVAFASVAFLVSVIYLAFQAGRVVGKADAFRQFYRQGQS
jgi:hypothetical protein